MLTSKNQKRVYSIVLPDFGAEVEVLGVRIQQHVGLHNQGVHRLVKVRDDCSATTHLIGGVCLQWHLSLADSSALAPLIGGTLCNSSYYSWTVLLQHFSLVDRYATTPCTHM